MLCCSVCHRNNYRQCEDIRSSGSRKRHKAGVLGGFGLSPVSILASVTSCGVVTVLMVGPFDFIGSVTSLILLSGFGDARIWNGCFLESVFSMFVFCFGVAVTVSFRSGRGGPFTGCVVVSCVLSFRPRSHQVCVLVVSSASKPTVTSTRRRLGHCSLTGLTGAIGMREGSGVAPTTLAVCPMTQNYQSNGCCTAFCSSSGLIVIVFMPFWEV